MHITIWKVSGLDATGYEVCAEYYMFKRSAKRAFNELTKTYPEYNWSYGGEPLELF